MTVKDKNQNDNMGQELINSFEIDYIFEDNKLKHNKFIPGVKIQIKKKYILKDKKNPIVVLAWNFYNDIKKNNSELSNNFINIKDLEKF